MLKSKISKILLLIIFLLIIILSIYFLKNHASKLLFSIEFLEGKAPLDYIKFNVYENKIICVETRDGELATGPVHDTEKETIIVAKGTQIYNLIMQYEKQKPPKNNVLTGYRYGDGQSNSKLLLRLTDEIMNKYLDQEIAKHR